MPAPDDETATLVAAAWEQFPATPSTERAVFGFDGYVDRVRKVVDERQESEKFDGLDGLDGFSARIESSLTADSSLSFEWLHEETRTGGHTCHLSRTFGKWGFDPAMFGMYGDPVLEPFRTEFDERQLHTLGEPGHTDAIEFDERKLMFTENGDTMALDWERLRTTGERRSLTARLDGAALLGVGYWAEMPNLPDVLTGLRNLWPSLEDPPRTVLLDPGDVRKLDAEQLRAGRDALGQLADVTRVIITGNRAEIQYLAETYGDETPGDMIGAAGTVFDAVDAAVIVCHSPAESVVVTPDSTGSVAVPVEDDPELTTSAGDHFNAGFALALHEGVEPTAAVAVGNAVAGHFVRTTEPPTIAELRTFLREYEDKF
jgi:hypothetical protein